MGWADSVSWACMGWRVMLEFVTISLSVGSCLSWGLVFWSVVWYWVRAIRFHLLVGCLIIVDCIMLFCDCRVFG